MQSAAQPYGVTPRIMKETKLLLEKTPPGVRVTVSDENPRHFLFDIQGPPGSFYEEGIFKVEIFLPADYPMSPPKALFRTKVFHPNIDKVGRICLDILKQDKWTPALLIEKVVLSI